MQTLLGLGSLIWTIVAGLLMLTVLVYVHELGHYWAAKSFGMHVKAFAVMMGGVRKTDLSSYLNKKLAPGRAVSLLFAIGFVVSVIGASLDSRAIYLAGICVMGVIVPAWVMLRLGALYHLPENKVLTTWAKSLAVGAIVLAFGTRMQGLSAGMVAGVASGATIIALLLIYYMPIQMKDRDDDEMGVGEITVQQGTKTEDFEASGEQVVVKERKPVDVFYRPVLSRIGKDGTEFSLLVLPLGGFAAIHGMHPKPDGSEQKIDRGFYSKSPFKRLIVLFAGPLFSVLFGLFLLFGLYTTIGKKEAVNKPVLGLVPESGPAFKAGLRADDVIVSIDGKKVDTFYDIVLKVKDKWRDGPDGKTGVPVVVAYSRKGQTKTATIVPIVDTDPLPLRGPDLMELEEKAIQARLGILYAIDYRAMTTSRAITEALKEPVQMAAGLASLFLKPAQAKENLSGPTLMAQATSAAVKEGAAAFIWFGAMLSISLGIMNLLPIVPLDGGQMVVATLELFRRGKRLSFHLQNLLANGGIAFLVILMLVATAADLGRSSKTNKDAAPVSGPRSESK